MRVLFVVAVALFLLPATARGQATDTRNRALIVLDASKSMNEDAGNGGTRLDAAKQAVTQLVDRLPEGAPIGLRVYGSKVSETSREEACRDTELVIPVGPLDKEQLTGAVNGLTGKGRTPIGNSLLATPDDLGSSEGRRSVILVSDGGDNCAPPNPCDAAREVARQGLDLTISVVGLQVNERVRRQLECIAREGGGSYSDVQDAGELGDELAALLARAYRSYEPSGTKVEGATTPGDGPNLSAGLFQDTMTLGDQRWYTLEVPAGRRVLASVTAIPPFESSGTSTLSDGAARPPRRRADRVRAGPAHRRGVGDRARARETPRASAPKARSTAAATSSASRSKAATSTMSRSRSSWGSSSSTPGEEVGLTREAGELATPTPTPTAPPEESEEPALDESTSLGWLAITGIGVARRADRADGGHGAGTEGRQVRAAVLAVTALLALPAPAWAQDDREPVVGGGSFNAAPILESGRFRDTLLPTEYLYYAFRLEPGQRLHVTANAEMPIDDFQRLGMSDITANFHSPTRSNYTSTPDYDVRGSFRVEGDPPLDIAGPYASAEEDTRVYRPLVRARRLLPGVLRRPHRCRGSAEGRDPVPLRRRHRGRRTVHADAQPVADAVADRHRNAGAGGGGGKWCAAGGRRRVRRRRPPHWCGGRDGFAPPSGLRTPSLAVHWRQVQIADRIRADVTTAMKAGERDRVTALRLVLSELQKAAKEGDADEVAVLRRERKRRREAETAYREAGRDELAEGEAFEATTIEAYLPAELSDAELDELVRAGVETTGAVVAARHGPGDQARDGGRRRPRRWPEGLDQSEGSAFVNGKTAVGGIERGGGGARRVAGRGAQDAGGAPRL